MDTEPGRRHRQTDILKKKRHRLEYNRKRRKMRDWLNSVNQKWWDRKQTRRGTKHET